MKNESLALGIAIALAGASLWGFSGSCTQFLFAHYRIDPMFITAFRMLVSGVIFMAVLYASKREQLRAIFRDRISLGRLVVMGAAGLFSAQVTYIFCISYTNAGTATVLQALSVPLTMLVACVFARRTPRKFEILGLVCAFVATVLIATKGNLGTLSIPFPGLVWGLLGAVAVTVYVMYPKKLFAQWGSLPVTGVAMLFGGITAGLIVAVSYLANAVSGGAVQPLAHFPVLDTAGWLCLLVIAVVGTFAAFGLYLKGVSMVGSVRGSMLGAIEPVSATVLSALWLHTPFGWADWTGLFLMIATIFLVAKQTD